VAAFNKINYLNISLHYTKKVECSTDSVKQCIASIFIIEIESVKFIKKNILMSWQIYKCKEGGEDVWLWELDPSGSIL